MREKIIFVGAEANIIIKNGQIIKKRVKKPYRIPEIDERIRKLRTRSEARILERASMEIFVPGVFKTDEGKKEIRMELIKGKRLSECLGNFSKKKQLEIAENIGKNTAKLHDIGIIHGDLTTSNIIFNEKNKRICFVDFGLGFFSQKTEDKAVDIYLLKEALESRHFQNWTVLFDSVKKGYKASKNSKAIFERLKKVESRGRYKERY